jgi:hypothetical protein
MSDARWCSGGTRFHHHGVKRIYDTIDEAWVAAFVHGTLHGEVMTVYRCSAIKRRESLQRCIPHPNPWAFEPYLRYWKSQDRKRRTTCGGFHITRKHHGTALPSPKKELQMSDDSASSDLQGDRLGESEVKSPSKSKYSSGVYLLLDPKGKTDEQIADAVMEWFERTRTDK